VKLRLRNSAPIRPGKQAGRRAHDSGARILDRQIAEQFLTRVAGAPLVSGNRVDILKDAAENYPAWLSAIRSARSWIHFESYIIHDDDIGRHFADALIARAERASAFVFSMTGSALSV